MLAAKSKKIPTVLHESNAFPGIAVKMLSKKVNLILVGFEDAIKKLPKAKKIVVTGTPTKLRKMELTTEEKKKITKEFGFKDYEPRVLIFGGSQGAQSINDSMIEIITEKSNRGYQIIWAAGPSQYDIIKEKLNEKGIDILISTNGSILKEETIQQIEHIKFKQFQVSIDGIGAWHDENRGVGFFEKADKTIDLLKKHNINNITIGTCITRDNIDELPQILEYVIKKEVDKFALMLLLPEGRATLEMDVKIEKLLEKLDEFWDIYRKNEIKFEFAENCVLPPVCIPKDLREKGLHKTFVVCCSFPNMMGISADGNVAPCDGFLGWKDYIAGNIYKDCLLYTSPSPRD